MFKEALHLVPAYGRDYATEWGARCAWFEGKDFKVVNGPYLSVRDAPHLRAQGYPCVVVHFDGFKRHVLVGLAPKAGLDHAVEASRVRDHLARLRVAEALRDTVDLPR